MVNPESRLDADMERRRLELNLEWRDVADRSGLSYETLRALRRTGRASALSKARAESALGWKAGSIDLVLGGGQAIVMELTELPEPGVTAQGLRTQIAELRDEIQHLEVTHERNRPYIVEHLQMKISELQKQLDALKHR